eukprot:Partr_v1_DN27814_c2_g1_i3_m23111 putative transmembrane protein 63C
MDESGDQQSADSSLVGLGIQVLFTFAIAIICIAVFETFRRRKSSIFSPRPKFIKNYAVPAPSEKFLGWIWPLLRQDEGTIDTLIGCDGALFLTYLRYSFLFFCVVALLGLVILIPINSTGSTAVGELDRITIGNIEAGSSKLWAHAVLTWVISGLAYLFIAVLNQQYMQLRRKYQLRLLADNSSVSRTVLLRNVPMKYRSDKSLRAFISRLDIGEIDRLQINVDLRQLKSIVNSYNRDLCAYENGLVTTDRAVEKHGSDIWLHSSQPAAPSSVDEFWSTLAQDPRLVHWLNPKYLPTHKTKGCCCCGTTVNSLDFHSSRIQVQRLRIERLEEENRFGLCRSAFVTFNSPRSAALAAQTILSDEHFGVMPAPEPRDVLWDNMPHSTVKKRTMSKVATLLSLALIIFCYRH